MKTLILTLALAPAALISTAYGGQSEVTVQFHQSVGVGSTFLPAGTYTIRSIDNSSNSPLLAFISDHGDTFTIPAMRAAEGHMAGKTTFVVRPGDPEQESGRVHLTEVWLAGKDYAYEIFTPRAHREPSSR